MMTIRCVLVALLATAAVAAPAPDCPVTDCLQPCPDGVYMKDGCPTCDCITDVEFCTVALCPTGTLCDNDRRECVPFACSLPVCEEECEYGFIFDDAGCPLCECAPDPCEDANCPTGTGCVVRLIAVQCIRAPCPSIYQAECVDPNVLKDGNCPPNDVIGICVVPDNACIGDGQCPGDEKCCSSGCNRVCLPPVKDEDCEELDCLEEARETCPNGVVTVFGCPTCQCQDEAPFCTRALCPVGTRCDDTLQACVPLEACPPVCAVFCEFGKVLDANGCETCECNPDPCRTMTCEPGTVCTTRVISVACIWGPCPPQVISSCVDPAPRAGDCPAFLFPPCAESLNQCTYDAECDKPDSKCCQDQCGATRCTAPAPACGTLNCHVSCEYGVLYDDIGCPTCDCYDPCENVQCEAGETCEGFYTPCPAGTPPQFCRPVGSCVHRCSELMCDLACPEGLSFKKDEYGCDICDCCPALDCSEACPYGHARDPQGCETCRCSNPCEVVKCGSGTQCVVIRVDIVCITTPCDPQFHAECVDSTPKPGDCPVLLSRRPCIDPNAVDECTLDTQCRGTYKCCDDGVCGVLRCQPPVLDCEDLDCLADIRERCPLGVVVRDGCPTCECLEETPFCAVALCVVGTVCDEERRACVPIECPPAICLVACEFGSDPDARGCPSCDCLPDPCETVDCKPDAVCVARPVDVGCATGSHCPVVYQAMCLDPNEKPGTCPVIFSRRVCTEPEPRDECSTDSGCRGDYKCCHDNICGVLKCMEPVPLCVCQLSGDPLIETYDKQFSLILKEQKTLLSRWDAVPSDPCKFQSRVQTDDDDGAVVVDFVAFSFGVHVKNDNKFQRAVQVFCDKILVRGHGIKGGVEYSYGYLASYGLSYNLGGGATQVEVSLNADGRTVEIRSDTCNYAMDVNFDENNCADSHVLLAVGPEYKPSGSNSMEGICGDCNDVKDDYKLCFTGEDVSGDDDKFVQISDSCNEGDHQHQD